MKDLAHGGRGGQVPAVCKMSVWRLFKRYAQLSRPCSEGVLQVQAPGEPLDSSHACISLSVDRRKCLHRQSGLMPGHLAAAHGLRKPRIWLAGMPHDSWAHSRMPAISYRAVSLSMDESI